MKISFTICDLIEKYGVDEALKRAAAMGFDAVDFSIFALDRDKLLNMSDEELERYFTDIRHTAEKYGLFIGQTHSHYPTWLGDIGDEERYILQQKAIQATAYMGCKYVVIHPTFKYDNTEHAWDPDAKARNMKFYGGLLPLLEQYDVTACIENMWITNKEKNRIDATVCSFTEELIDYVKTLDNPHYAVCHDAGHSNLLPKDEYPDVNPASEVRKLKGLVKVVHVHETDRKSDLHTMPFATAPRNNDWTAYLQTLRDIGYDGIMNFETGFPTFFDEEFEQEAGVLMCKIARKFANAVQG